MSRAPRWVLVLALAPQALSAGCPGTNVRDLDAAMPAPDVNPLDARSGDASLGAMCAPSEPPCLQLHSEEISLRVGASGGRARVNDMLFDRDRLLVATGEYVDDYRLVVRAREADGTLAPVMTREGVSQSATLASTAAGLRAYWWQSVAPRDPRSALVEDAMVGASMPRTLTTLPTARTEAAPSVTASGAVWVSVPGELRRIRGDDVHAFEVAETVFDRATAVEAGEGVTHVLWHRIDGDRFETYVSTIEGDTLTRTEPVFRETSGARMLVHDGEVWVAAFSLTWADLAESQVRVARLSGRDLTRLEPDRALYGWGGLGPIDVRLIAMPTAPAAPPQPWLVVLTGDARFGSGLALHARPLREEPCRDEVGLPLFALGREGWGAFVESGALAMHPDGLGFVVGHDTPEGFALHDVTLCER